MGEEQENWNESIRQRICENLYKSLIRLCGGGYVIGNSMSSIKKDDWDRTLKNLAYSSVSFPNKNVCLPFDIDSHPHLLQRKAGGKPHDIEIRAALKFFHNYNSKKRRRNEIGGAENYQKEEQTLEVISDMGISRTIYSSVQLAKLLCIFMEDDSCNNIRPNNVMKDTFLDIQGTLGDFRSDRSGLICVVTKWRGLLLRSLGKLPCPTCIKWCKGQKGLWWHQQMEHANTHSAASTIATSESNPYAIIPYDPKVLNIRKLSTGEKRKHSSDLPMDEFELVKKGNFCAFKEALTKGFSPLSSDKNGATALHWAAGSGHLVIVQFLIEKCGSSPDVPQKGKRSFLGRTPLHWAARNGHIDVAKYLIESQNVNIDATTVDGTTAFCWACWQGHIDVMRYLYSKGCDAHKVNNFGCNAVLWSAQGNSNLPVIKWLESIGCDFAKVNCNGHSIIHKAAQRGNMEFFRYSYSKISSENVLHLIEPDSDGCCPSDLAGMEGHEYLALYISGKEIAIAKDYGKKCIASKSNSKGKRQDLCSEGIVQSLPKWLTLAMEDVKHYQKTTFKQMEKLWEAQGGAKRMAMTIIDTIRREKGT